MEILNCTKIFIVVFICLSITNCNQKSIETKEEPEVTMKILKVNNEKEHNLKVTCLITNHSNTKLYFPISPDLVKLVNSFEPSLNDPKAKKTIVNGTSFFSIFYKDDSIIYAHFVDIQVGNKKIYDSLTKVNEKLIKKFNKTNVPPNFWGIRYWEIKKNGFYVDPNSTKEITLTINPFYSIAKKFLIYDIGWYFISEKPQKVGIQTAISIDSLSLNNELLLPEDIDSLKQNNIKIFYGKVFSNKVPVDVYFRD